MEGLWIAKIAMIGKIAIIEKPNAPLVCALLCLRQRVIKGSNKTLRQYSTAEPQPKKNRSGHHLFALICGEKSRTSGEINGCRTTISVIKSSK
jgi:hypothetical protein